MAYNVNFISGNPVTLPVIPPEKKKEIAPLINGKGYLINYAHHSVVLNKKRKLAFFAASNINGKEWKNINRKGIFKKDVRAVLAKYNGEELLDCEVSRIRLLKVAHDLENAASTRAGLR